MGKKALSILRKERLHSAQPSTAGSARKRKAPGAALASGGLATSAQQRSPRKRARSLVQAHATAPEVAAEPAAQTAAAGEAADAGQPSHTLPPAQKPWWPSSVIDRQAAQALARLLTASARGRGGASIKVNSCGCCSLAFIWSKVLP